MLYFWLAPCTFSLPVSLCLLLSLSLLPIVFGYALPVCFRILRFYKLEQPTLDDHTAWYLYPQAKAPAIPAYYKYGPSTYGQCEHGH
jgi:hypothetical protein